MKIIQKVIIFSLLICSAYSSKYDAVDNINKHLKYLAEKGILDKSQISFVQSNALTKKDIIGYLYKILKVIDLEKAVKEDLNVLENVVSEISDYISIMKHSVEQNENNVNTISKEVLSLKLELLNLKSSVADLKTKLTEFENRIDKSSGESFKRFFNLFQINWNAKAFMKVNKASPFSYESAIAIKSDKLSIDIFNSNYATNAHLFKVGFKTKIGAVKLYSFNSKVGFASSRREVFFTSFSNNGFNKNLLGIETKLLDLFISEDAGHFDGIIKLKHRLIDFYGVISDGLTVGEILCKVPTEFVCFGVGLKLANRAMKSWLIFLDGKLDHLSFGVEYAHSIKGDKNILSPFLSYIFSEKNFIGTVINMDLNNIILYRNWRLILNFNLKEIFVTRFLAEEKESNFFSGFVANFDNQKFGFFGSVFFKNDAGVKVAIAVEAKVLIQDFIKVFARYTKSDFDFYDNVFDFKGNSFSFLPFEGILSRDDLGTFCLGLNLEI